MHAAARRARAHLLLEAEDAAEKVERGANVVVEEVWNDLWRFGGYGHRSVSSSLPSPSGRRLGMRGGYGRDLWTVRFPHLSPIARPEGRRPSERPVGATFSLRERGR